MRCTSDLSRARFLLLIGALSCGISLPVAAHTASTTSTVTVATTVQGAPPAESPLVPARLERWLDDGDRELITQTFRRHPELVLPFFDRYLEKGLKLIADKANYEDSMKELRRGVKFAQIATDAWRDPIFAEYAANFASWNEVERTNFRAGQAAFGAGARAMKAGKPAEAREHFQNSMNLAEPLGDAWGMQMAMAGLAQAALALQDWQAANDASLKAMDIAGRLQLRSDEIEQILICVEARKQLKTPDSGVGHGRLAWSKLKQTDPPELRATVAEAFAAALDRTGKADEAAKIRAEVAAPAPSNEKPASDPAKTPASGNAPSAPSAPGAPNAPGAPSAPVAPAGTPKKSP